MPLPDESPGATSLPRRSELLSRLERANRLAAPWTALQIVVTAALAYLVDWSAAAASPLISIVAVTVVVGPELMGVLRFAAARRKEIGDLKEQTRFGEFDKHKLRRLVDETLVRLQLPLPGPPVFVTADKSMNAGALHLGFGGFFRGLNGVYLNRQVLHRLTPAEVQDIVGHELGHFYRYYLVVDRLRIVTLLMAATAGLFTAQWLGLSNWIGFVALAGCSSAAWYFTGYLHARNGEAIEYLCDDLGAQVNGVVTSINGLLKVGADAELQLAVHQQELRSRRYGNLNARDIVEAIEAATPYGHTTREELQQAVEASLKRRSQDRRRLTLGGFLEFAWQGDGDEGLDEALQKARAVQKLPRLDWESLLDEPGRIALNEQQVAQLVEWLEDDPKLLLFQLPSEVGDAEDVHPPLRSRILYLWKNRREIAGAATS